MSTRMTRRERLERKLDKREEWAGKAAKRSDSAFDSAHQLADQIPLGQPILVGHHSERHARRDQNRIHSRMSRGVEQAKLGDYHRAKAGGIARALDRSIFSDDENAIEAIEARIATNEAKRERMKLTNKLYRKADKAKLADMGLDYDRLREKLEAPDVMSWCRIPYPAYEISNLGGRITADRKRLDAIRVRSARAEAAEQAGGVAIEDCESGYCRVTFAEKPPRDVLDVLKSAGFCWSSGSWAGKRENLPSCVQPPTPEES